MNHRRLLKTLFLLISSLLLLSYFNSPARAMMGTSSPNLLTRTTNLSATTTLTSTATLTPTLAVTSKPETESGSISAGNLPIMEIVLGLIIGLMTGILIGYLIFQSRGEKNLDQSRTSNQSYPDPSYMEVISVLIGLTPDTRDYLGDMFNILVLSKKTNKRNQMLDKQDLLGIMQDFLDQLSWKLGLEPVAQVLSDGEIQLMTRYDPSRHNASPPPRPGTPVKVIQAGWQIRRGDGSIQIIRKARVKVIRTEQ